MVLRWMTPRLVDLWCEVSADRLYGFERFILQNIGAKAQTASQQTLWVKG
jgi:hypothetical protein